MKYKAGDIVIGDYFRIMILSYEYDEYKYCVINYLNEISKFVHNYNALIIDNESKLDIKSTRKEKLKQLYEI